MRWEFRRYAAVLGVVLGLATILVVSAIANVLSGATATADCNGYNPTVNATDLTPGTDYTINYSFTVTCGASSNVVSGSMNFTTTNNGSSTDTNATETASGNWLNSGSLSTNCSVTGTATLTSSGSTMSITINGAGTAAPRNGLGAAGGFALLALNGGTTSPTIEVAELMVGRHCPGRPSGHAAEQGQQRRRFRRVVRQLIVLQRKSRKRDTKPQSHCDWFLQRI